MFRVISPFNNALVDLKAGPPRQEDESVNMEHFEKIAGLDRSQNIEREFGGPRVSGE